MPKTDEDRIVIPAAPMFERIGETRGAIAAFARKLGISHGQLSNWKQERRGIPWSKIDRVVAALGMQREEYFAKAGIEGATTGKHARSGEAKKLVEDFTALPPWLQEHIARKTAELRRYADALPEIVREGMKGPPSDPDAWRRWERSMESDMNGKFAKERR